MYFLALAAGGAVDWWPFVVLLVSLAAIVGMITVLRMHPFVALIVAAVLAGLLAKKLPGEVGTFPEDPAKGRSHWVQAVELTAAEFGTTAGKIAVVIALASVVGVCLMESGAADKVVRRFLAVFGEKRAGAAIATSSYVMSIPIFFDTFFMLLLPLARAMRVRTGRDYLLFVMAICCGSIVTHSLVAPHPGPLAMAEALQIDLGVTIVAGIVLGIIPTMVSWQVVKWLNRRMEVPLRETPGAPLKDLEEIVARPEHELPSFLGSIGPVVAPIFLISLASFFDAVARSPGTFPWVVAGCGGMEAFRGWNRVVEFVGNRNVALLIGAVMAVWVLMRQRRLSVPGVNHLLGPPLETAGVIILITSAGGAFGLMLKNAGVGEAIQQAVAGREVNLILLSWFVASVIRVAQGSATVSMLTTSAMVYPILSGGEGLPYHPVYVFAAIGFGAMIMSWMNDSGFWVVSRLSGMTEAETLKSWTVIATVNSVVGLGVCLLGAALLPMAAGGR